MLIMYLCLIALAGSVTSAQEYRLPSDVVPDSYEISIKPYLQPEDGIKQFSFEGEVNITLHAVQQNVQNITLHKANIDILDTVLCDSNGKVLERLTTNQLVYVSVTDQLTIRLQNPLTVNFNYTLNFKYTGLIRNDMRGIFRATYDNTSWYAVTQLHGIDARTVFPCFDEPQLKSTFRMQITRPKEYKAYSNTRLVDTIDESDGRYTDYFKETPRMSTYLVAFLVGDFVAEGDEDFKLIMHSKFNNQTAFTHEVVLKAMNAYDSYTQMPYKSLGNTIMQMAGSVSFPHSGMENWGLVLYKDTVLAHEPHYTDGWSSKENSMMILFHEIAHMWFGNSVAHKWWSYFWLNEAFPSYYQYFLANEIYPEYESDKQFIVNVIHKMLDTDATSNTQPLTSPEASIQSPSQIAYKLSNVAYDKGAAVVRMICNCMGKKNFDNSMREYLKENYLRSTVPEDLFVHWRRHWPAGHNVDSTQLFKDWTEQPGFPLLRLTRTAAGLYSLKQERFLLNQEDGSDATLTYTVPITYTTNREQNFEDLTPKFYLNKTIGELEFGYSNSDEWLILNLQQSNYHRVFYEAPLLNRLRKAFRASNHSGIHVLNRAQVVDDLFTFGRIGLLGYDVILEFMEYLSTETEYIAWVPAFKGLETISQRLTLAQHEKFAKYLFDILGPVYKKLYFENSNDTVLDVYHRNQVISWLCRYQHVECNDEAYNFFHWYIFLVHKPSLDFVETLYCAASREGAFNHYALLATEYRAAKITSEKEKILRAMGCTKNFVSYQYAFILSDDVPQDLKTAAIRALYSQTPENIMPVYYAVTETVEPLTKKLGSWSATASVISGIADYFTDMDQLAQLKEFISTNGHLFGSSVSSLEDAVQTVEKNLAWSDKHLDKLFQYLDSRSGAVGLQNILTLVAIMAIGILYFN